MSIEADRALIEELRFIGLGPLWLRVAEAIGPVRFIEVLKELDDPAEKMAAKDPSQ